MTTENGDKKGWSVALAEAAANGLPIVSTGEGDVKLFIARVRVLFHPLALAN